MRRFSREPAPEASGGRGTLGTSRSCEWSRSDCFAENESEIGESARTLGQREEKP